LTPAEALTGGNGRFPYRPIEVIAISSVTFIMSQYSLAFPVVFRYVFRAFVRSSSSHRTPLTTNSQYIVSLLSEWSWPEKSV